MQSLAEKIKQSSSIKLQETESILEKVRGAAFLFLAGCLMSYFARRSSLSSGWPIILLLGYGVFALDRGALLARWSIPWRPHNKRGHRC
jgi:hypothetical protein